MNYIALQHNLKLRSNYISLLTVQDLLFSLDYYHLKTAFMVAVGREVKSRERGVKNEYKTITVSSLHYDLSSLS